ncbi:PB1 domain-containing protein/Pkinase_Tyr domain-containing protein [Cephalotus follicularis]|uniref:PB1 domain-containing protein/Pkinase_Tyr domain-containing protein n=1 Tax=Cephalotus follicularis TaxID=3775 RepID=A0A1Q3BRY7_CEPFO|nr:PB1 domain-containing protein/Pkinase_Tyr domain-containing protein [Cephalotus follicularis]
MSDPMASEAPGLSGQGIQQDSTSAVPRAGRKVHNNSNKNVPEETGDKFSMEFLQDHVASRVIAAVPVMAQNHEKRVVPSYNQAHQLGYEDLARILGLRRMDSECASDASDLASARGSIKEFENGAYFNKLSRCQREDSETGYRLRKAFHELNCERSAGSGPTSSLIDVSVSPHFNKYDDLGVLDQSPYGKMKFLCSFGGKILPRPSDGKLRYVGGETRIISIRKNLLWEELVKKTSAICKQPHTIRYQLPGEDLDALISVSSDEDLQNMIEEYHGLERLEGSQRLRIFLIPLGDTENTSSLEASTMQQCSPDYQYVVAVNGVSSPMKSSGEQALARKSSQPATILDHSSIFHRRSPSSPFPLEVKGCSNALHPSRFSPNQSPPISPIPLERGDSKSVHIHFTGDDSSIGSNSSFFTSQLQPENSIIDGAGYRHLPQGPVTVMNHHQPYKKVDAGQPDQSHGVQFPNHDASTNHASPSSFDLDNSDFDVLSCEKPMHRERTFHSEKPISRPEDLMGLLSGTIESLDFHQGIPHAYSDSKLQEQGGRSAYCSQEGMSPLSPLNFAKTQLSSLIVSSASHDKPIKLQENIEFVNSCGQNKFIDIDSSGSQGKPDLLNDSRCSEPLGRNGHIYKGTKHIDDKIQTAKNDANQSNLLILNHLDENPSNFVEMNRVDGSDPLLPQCGKIYDKNELHNANCNQTSPVVVDMLTQDMEVSGGILPASSADNFKPSINPMEHSQNSQVEKTPADLVVMDQKTSNDQHCALHGTRMIGGQGGNVSWNRNSEVAPLFSSRRQSCDENPLSDLMSGSSSGLVFHEPAPLRPVASEKDMGLEELMLMSSTNLYSPATCDDDGRTPIKIHLHSKLHNPAKDAAKREVSLLDDDHVNYPDRKVDELGFGLSVYKKSNVDDVMLAQTKPSSEDEAQLEPAVIVDDVTDSMPHGIQSLPSVLPLVVDASSDITSPTGTETESTFLESDYEDTKIDDEDKDGCLSDAFIAELEANTYGLQIIKNADLEELRELGSGTYGTVYHGKWRGTDVAIKRIKKSCFAGRSSEQERLTKDFWREAQILSNLHHPNVVAFYGVVPDGAGGTLATVTEFMVNGSLRHVLLKKDRSLDRRRKLIIAMDAAFGMEYLHSKNIVHFDLKCDNLLVNLRDPQRPVCKVGDFGLSRIKRNTLVSGGVRGTLPWMAPELLNGSSSRVSEKVDVFSFGISMWEILTGEEPYADMHCGAIIGGIVKNTLRPTIPERCDPEWRKLMERCWSPDPESRPSFTEITNKLRSMSMARHA